MNTNGHEFIREADNLGSRTEGTTVTEDLVSFGSFVRGSSKSSVLSELSAVRLLELVSISVHSRLDVTT